MLREDVPAPDAEFGYSLIAEALLQKLNEPRTAAFVLGIHGPWGAGKSTLVQTLRRKIAVSTTQIIVEFNAWKFQDREALWRALIICVLQKLQEQPESDVKEIGSLKRALYSSFTVKDKGQLRVDWGSATTEVLLFAMRLGTANLIDNQFGGFLDRVSDRLNRLFNRKQDADDAKTDDVARTVERVGKILNREVVERNVQQVVSIEQFLQHFRELVGKLSKGKQLYVLIDDLDRCLPESALEVFEAVKLFLDAPECAYIVALDRDVIRRGLAIRYAAAGPGVIDADEYIEKTISLSFDLPILSAIDGQGMLIDCAGSAALSAEEAARVVNLLGTNPRRLKRFGHSLSVLFTLATAVGTPHGDVPAPSRPADRDLFLKLALIAYRNSSVFSLMARDPGFPKRLQEAANGFQEASRNRNEAEALAQLAIVVANEHPVVREAVSDPGFWRIVAASPPLNVPSSGGVSDRVQNAIRWFTQSVRAMSGAT